MLCGILKTTFFELLAIVASSNPLLGNIHFPQSQEECSKAAIGFQSKSFSGAVKNVVSVLDDYLLRIQVPCVKDVGNVRSFFNGHYQGTKTPLNTKVAEGVPPLPNDISTFHYPFCNISKVTKMNSKKQLACCSILFGFIHGPEELQEYMKTGKSQGKMAKTKLQGTHSLLSTQ